MREGTLFIISGPAGSGKGTVVKALMEKHTELVLSISATTRKPRQGEEHGREYFFITEDEFKRRIEGGEMLEYNNFTGNGNYYGTPRKEVEEALVAGKDVILEIEVNGAMQVKNKFEAAVAIMLTPPNGAVLEKRLTGRGTEQEDEIKKRLATAKEEIKLLPKYDYSVVNEDGKIEECADLIYSIIVAERHKTAKTKSIIENFR